MKETTITPHLLAGKVVCWYQMCEATYPSCASLGAPFTSRDVSSMPHAMNFCLLPDTSTDAIGEVDIYHVWSL